MKWESMFRVLLTGLSMNAFSDLIYKHALPYQFCLAIGEKNVKQYHLNPALGRMSKEALIFACCVAVFNLAHKKFHITHATVDEQLEYIRAIKARIAFTNPFLSPDVEFGVKTDDFDDENWESCKYSELDNKREEWNLNVTIEENNDRPLHNFCCGVYKYEQGGYS